MNFQETELAKKIIARCVAAGAWPEFKRLTASETETDFLSVLTDNWLWSFENKVLDFETVCEFSGDSRKEKNVSAYNAGDHSCNTGYCVIYGSATVEAYDSATVRASGSTTVRAYGSTTVRAYGSATVRAYDSATVRAYDSATINSYTSNGHTVEQYAVCRYLSYSGEVSKVIAGPDFLKLIK